MMDIINNLSDEELIYEYHKYESRAIIGEVTQMALKIL